MAETAPRLPLSQTEAAALGLAALGHVALVAALVWLKPADPPPPPPSRMAVSLTSETGLVSTAPDPQLDAARDAGPVVGDMALPPEPAPIPLAKAELLRSPAPALRPQVRPLTPQPATRPPRPVTSPGNASFENAFRDGIPGGNNKAPGKNPPAEATGALRNSWTSLIGSKVRGPWNACKVTGLDIEQLYVDISFVLAADGTIQSIAEPVVGGVTPANRTQVAPFKACAVRAIKLAAPFADLPPQFHNDWKSRKLRLKKREQ